MKAELLSIIGTVAPAIATALGGPLAGMAVKVVADALGVEPTESAVTSVLSTATPELLAKLREADREFAVKMKELDVNLEKIAADDRASARQAAVQGGTAWPLFWLSLVLLGCTLGAEMWVLLDGYPKEVPDIVVGRILGLFDAVAMLVLGFWYGTSKGSQDKDATIRSMTK